MPTHGRSSVARLVGLALVGSFVVGCQSGVGGGAATSSDTGSTAGPVLEVKPQDGDHAQQTMALLHSLDGEWELVNTSEEMPEGRAVFAVSSAGSVVREIMVPGTPFEMTNLYHMDGDDVVCTHYCAAGNQPRMVAKAVTDVDGGKALDFEFDSVSNFVEGQDHYMGGVRLVFVDDDHFTQEWTSFNAKGEVAGELVFEMRRVK